MAYVRLEPIEGQYDTPLRLGQTPQPRRVLERERHQFVVALQEIADRAGCYRQTTLNQRLMNGRDTGVMDIALRADEGKDIKAKLVLGKDQAPFFFRAVGTSELRTGTVKTTPDLQREMHHVF